MIAHILEVVAVWITGVISAGGYGGVMLLMAIESACVPLPSEIIMPFSGYLVYTGRFSLLAVATWGAIGCNLGSVLAYEIGYFGGRPLVERYGRYIFLSHRELNIADKFFERRGAIAVLIARLLPVIRTFIALPAGIARIAPRLHVRNAALNALEQSGFVDAQFDHRVECKAPHRQHAVKRLRLRHCAREAVEDEAFARIRLFDALGDDLHHDLIRHQSAARHDVLRLPADRRAGLHCCTQHVSGRELDDTVLGDEMLGLRSFASPRRAQQDQSHLRRPLSFERLIKPSYWWASR